MKEVNQITKSLRKVDVLICANERDIDYLLEQCLRACIIKFELLKHIYIVTNAEEKLKNKLNIWQLNQNKISIFTDEEVLGVEYAKLDGWYRQQLIKLSSDKVCKTDYICCLGADTVILRNITEEDLFSDDLPILYYNRYKTTCIHLEYERRRVENVSDILAVIPQKSYLFGDFIMDLMIFDRKILQELRTYLEVIFGSYPFLKIITNSARNLYEKTRFGEWTLYAIFILDVLKIKVRIRNSRNEFVAQLHSQKDLDLFQFNSSVVHFVNKSLDKNYIIGRLNQIDETNNNTALKNYVADTKCNETCNESCSLTKRYIINPSCMHMSQTKGVVIRDYEGFKKVEDTIGLFGTIDYRNFWLPNELLRKESFTVVDIGILFNVKEHEAIELINEMASMSLIKEGL